MPSVKQLNPLLQELKIRQLSTLLRSIGANTTGVKSELVARCISKLSQGQPNNHEGPARLLSIDMGVKNLAYCLCDVRLPQARLERSPTKTRKGQDSQVGPEGRPLVDLKEWKCMSLVDAIPRHEVEDFHNRDTYHPRNMSLLALNLVRSAWLPLKPSRILIERQRFRSARSPQVQEWTVRVNMLESMLYAIFAATAGDWPGRETGDEQSPLEAVEGVSPARVAAFWADESEVVDQALVRSRASQGTARARAVKKEKIDLVRRWVQDPSSAPFTLSFSGGAEQMSRPFAMGKTRGQKRRDVLDGHEGSSQPAKLDDLADCFLQAAAWVQWEANKRLIAGAEVQEVQDLEQLLDRLQHSKR